MNEATEARPSPLRPAPPPLRRWTFTTVLLSGTFVIALIETIGHFVVLSRVPDPSEWEAVAERLQERIRESDGIVVAPEWAEPVARHALGDLMTIERAAYSDLAGFPRVFEISARGRRHPDLRGLTANRTERVGRLTLREYALGPSPVLADLVDHLPSAQVTLVTQGSEGTRDERPCPFGVRRAGRGGLGAGPMMPRERFVCDRAPPWVYVGETVTEDLELRPRRCVWQHPAADATIATTFDDVALGDRLVLYAGLYYEHERMLEHGPFELRVFVDGQEAGLMRHRDGDGWKRIEVQTSAPGAPTDRRGSVRIEVRADDPHLRSVCWAAQTRRGARRPGSATR